MWAYLPRQMGVRGGLWGPKLRLLVWLFWVPWVWSLSCMSLAIRSGSGGGVSGWRRGGGAGSGMSGALLARSLSFPPSLSRSPPLSLLLSFRGLISLAKAFAPDHWLFLENTQHLYNLPNINIWKTLSRLLQKYTQLLHIVLSQYQNYDFGTIPA